VRGKLQKLKNRRSGEGRLTVEEAVVMAMMIIMEMGVVMSVEAEKATTIIVELAAEMVGWRGWHIGWSA